MLPLLLFVVTGQAQTGTYAASEKSSNNSRARFVKFVGAMVKAQVRSADKIMLNWMPFQGGVSHYVLERSEDGRNYQEACVFFTGEWNDEPEYWYTDRLRKPLSGTLYYRLRVVGLDETEVYTLPTKVGK